MKKALFTALLLLSSSLLGINSANAVITCPSGSVISSTDSTKCISTPATVSPTSPQTIYTCPAGYTLSGSNCTTTPKPTQIANSWITYSCPSGGSLSGSTCYYNNGWVDTSYSATANYSYSCPDGGTLSGTTCTVADSTSTYTATSTNSCPSGYHYYLGDCVNNSTGSVTNSRVTTYSCPNGGTLSGTTCTVTTSGRTYTATSWVSSYSCPSGGDLSNSTCVRGYYATGTYSATATTNYSCPDGGTLNTSHYCEFTALSVVATISYSGTCPMYYTLNAITGICEAVAFIPPVITGSIYWLCSYPLTGVSSPTRYSYDATIPGFRDCTKYFDTNNSSSTDTGIYICEVTNLTSTENYYYTSQNDETKNTEANIITCDFIPFENSYIEEEEITANYGQTDTCDNIFIFSDYLACLNAKLI